MVLSQLLLQPSWPSFHSYSQSNLDQCNQNMKVYESYGHEMYSTISTTPENSSVSSVSFPVLANDSGHCHNHDHDHDQVDMYNSSLVKTEEFDDESMEFDSHTGIKNLLMAYAKAIEMEQEELAKVIVKCISEKANPNGSPLERVAFNLFQPDEKQENAYLFQESLRNYNLAFRAFYNIFPYVRFAHLTAGSAIVESVPSHVDLVHIIDFDMCEGIQWPPVIEAIARIKKSLIITSIKLDEDQDLWFDRTRWHLCNYARSLGLNLKVQEMGMAQMMKEMDEVKLETKFMAFNCMIGLLHTRRTRKTTQVMDFLEVARRLLAKNQGIITLGDDLEDERMSNYLDFSSFFNKNLAYYNALYQSMEWGFSGFHNEARIAMETLFLAPFVSSKAWFEKWEEQRESMVFDMNFQEVYGLQCERTNLESWHEAREFVKEGVAPYRIRIGENENGMILEWKETPLVRMRAWKVMMQMISG